MAVARDYAERDVSFLAVNSNDAERYPADSAEAMRSRVEAGEFACPYLHDASQEAARAWGAKTTPDVLRPRRATCGSATAARPTPTTTTPP